MGFEVFGGVGFECFVGFDVFMGVGFEFFVGDGFEVFSGIGFEFFVGLGVAAAGFFKAGVASSVSESLSLSPRLRFVRAAAGVFFMCLVTSAGRGAALPAALAMRSMNDTGAS